MKLRTRRKDEATRVIDDENEEDVDDPDEPADDSDSDPEWAVPQEDSERSFSGVGRKRKAFIPFPEQMQREKIQIIGDAPEQSNKIIKVQTSSPSTSDNKISCSRDPSGESESEEENESQNIFSTNELLEHFENKVQQKNVIDNLKGKIKNALQGSSSNNQPKNTGTPTSTITLSKSTPTTSKRTTAGPASTKRIIINVNENTSFKQEMPSFKVVKLEPSKAVPSTSLMRPNVPVAPTAFSNGDFLRDLSKKKDFIWQVDGMNLLQKFVPVTDKNGDPLYKSSFTYDGLSNMNTSKFQKLKATIVNKIKNEVFVKVHEDVNPLRAKQEPEVDIVSSTSEDTQIASTSSTSMSSISTSSSTIIQKTPETITSGAIQNILPIIDNTSISNYKKTFKDEFIIFLQALISQCLDSSFLSTVYADKDTYFLDKIKAIDDVLEAKKFSLMSSPHFPDSDRILYAIHTYPVMEEKQLKAVKMENFNCVVCTEQKQTNYSNVCLELSGEPYEKNTLCGVTLLIDVDEDLKVLLVCTRCCKLLKLYSKMCHTKYLIYKQCEKSVKKILETNKTIDASEVIINLLNNEPWCETKLLNIIRDWISVDDMKRAS